MEIKFFLPAGNSPEQVLGGGVRRDLGAMDRGAVHRHPGANLLHDPLLGRGDGAVSVGAHVQQEIPAVPRAEDDLPDEVGGGFQAGVFLVVAPAGADGLATLPEASGSGRGEVLLGGGNILRQSGPVINEDVRLQSADHGVQFPGTPVLRADFGIAEAGNDAAVIPEVIYFSIVSHELPDLVVGFLDHAFPAGGIFRGAGVNGGPLPTHD